MAIPNPFTLKQRFNALDQGISGGIGISTPDQGWEISDKRAHHLAKRLRLVLFDLGLSESLPKGWITPTAEGVGFNQLSLKQTESLVRTLEGVVGDRLPFTVGAGVKQPSLFGGRTR